MLSIFDQFRFKMEAHERATRKRRRKKKKKHGKTWVGLPVGTSL